MEQYPSLNYEYKEMANGFFVELNYDAQKTAKVVEKPTEKLSLNQTKIIKLIFENSLITSEELALKIGIRSDSVRENLSKLKKQGYLTRIGPAKGGYWKIRDLGS